MVRNYVVVISLIANPVVGGTITWVNPNGANSNGATVQQCWDSRSCTETTVAGASATTAVPLGKSLTVRVRQNPTNPATHLPSAWAESTASRDYPERVTGFALNDTSISASVLPNPATTPVVLSDEGTLDWVHWGLTATGDVNRKSNATVQIGALQAIGGELTRGTALSHRPSFSWTGGTPTASATGTRVYMSQANMPPGTGFRFTFPGSPSTTREAVLYLNALWNTSTVTATIDGASSSIALGSLSSGNTYEVRIPYRGNGDLVVDYIKTSASSTLSLYVMGAALTEPE